MIRNEFIKGADLSSLDEVEKCGGKFYDCGAQGDAMEILRSPGMNLVRLRIWNDPKDEQGNTYGAGSNDINVTISLARRAKALGMKWLLDFHYSDFWADPGKQFLPKAWRKMSEDELCGAVYDFTKSTLERLSAEGLTPDIIAVGNEITHGLLWPIGKAPNFRNIARFVSAGIRAVRVAAPKSKVMIHLDMGGKNDVYREWFDSYFAAGGEQFDVIGMSYYPFWHGTMAEFKENMFDISARYDKDIIVCETSMGFSLDDYSEYEGLPKGTIGSGIVNEELAKIIDYPLTADGQRKFIGDLAKTIKSVPGDRGRGFIWWEPAWIPVKNSGWTTPAGLKYVGEDGICANLWANQALFDFDGNALPALHEIEKM